MRLQFNVALVAIGPRDAQDNHVIQFVDTPRDSTRRMQTVHLTTDTDTARQLAGHFGQSDAVRVTFEAGEPAPSREDEWQRELEELAESVNAHEAAWMGATGCVNPAQAGARHTALMVALDNLRSAVGEAANALAAFDARMSEANLRAAWEAAEAALGAT